MERLSKAGIAEERLSYFGRATDLIAVKGLKLTRFQQVAFADSGPYQRIQSIAENLGLAEKQITNQAQYEQTLTNIKNAYELDRLDHVTALPEMPKTYDEFKNLCDKFRPK